MNISLSQESSDIFYSNHLFLKDLQILQQNQILESDSIIKPKQEEITATVRQAFKISENVPSVLAYCETRINKLLADVTSIVGGKRKQENSDRPR